MQLVLGSLLALEALGLVKLKRDLYQHQQIYQKTKTSSLIELIRLAEAYDVKL